MSDWELWACAHEMISQHGGKATMHAAMKADEMLAKGDADGAFTWCLHEPNPRIARAGLGFAALTCYAGAHGNCPTSL